MYDSSPIVSTVYSDSKYLDNCEVLATSYEDIFVHILRYWKLF
jgi:hypothetical protein